MPTTDKWPKVQVINKVRKSVSTTLDSQSDRRRSQRVNLCQDSTELKGTSGGLESRPIAAESGFELNKRSLQAPPPNVRFNLITKGLATTPLSLMSQSL